MRQIEPIATYVCFVWMKTVIIYWLFILKLNMLFSPKLLAKAFYNAMLSNVEQDSVSAEHPREKPLETKSGS